MCLKVLAGVEKLWVCLAVCSLFIVFFMVVVYWLFCVKVEMDNVKLKRMIKVFMILDFYDVKN